MSVEILVNGVPDRVMGKGEDDIHGSESWLTLSRHITRSRK